jgi:hypothetical protein
MKSEKRNHGEKLWHGEMAAKMAWRRKWRRAMAKAAENTCNSAVKAWLASA